MKDVAEESKLLYFLRLSENNNNRSRASKNIIRKKNILSRWLKSRKNMLFPEKMIDFIRTTGPFLICGESLASGKYLAKMAKKKKKNQHQNKV